MSIRLAAIAALAISASLAWTAAAGAQDAKPAPDFPTRPISALSSDQAEAADLITASNRPGLFKNVTDHQGPAVLHLASGMICRFAARERSNNLVVYRAEPGIEDVGCNTMIDGVYLTHYAYLYPTLTGPQNEMLSAIAAVQQAYPDVRDYTGEIATASATDRELPDIYRSRGVIALPSGEGMTKIMVSQVGGWMLKQRMTVPMERARDGDFWSELQFIRVQIEVSDHRAAEGAD